MAEQILPNYLATAQNAYAFGHGQGAQRKAQENQSRLSLLASQAYGAPQDQRAGIVQQAVGIDPDAGFSLDKQLQGGDDAREKSLLNTARLIDQAPPEMKEAIFQRVRPAIEQHLPNLPANYNDQVGQGIKAFIASRSSAQAGNVQSRFVGEDGQVYALMRDGSVQPLGIKADPRTQLIEGAGGFYGVDMRRGVATPVQVGGVPQQQAPQPRTVTGPDGRPLDLSGITDPRMRDEIAANPGLWQVAPDGGGVQMPDQAPIMGGGQLQAPIDPGKEVRTLNPQEVSSRGYRPGSIVQVDGLGNEKVIQAPTQDRASMSDAERKSILAAKAKVPQLQNAIRGLDRIDSALKALNGGMINTGPIDQFAQRYTKEGQELDAAVGGIQNAFLALTRVPGIGSQSDLEARIAMLQYPSLDKDPEVNKRTMQQLKFFAQDLAEAYQAILSGASGAAQQGGGTATGGYQVGQVIEHGGKRYRVTGGDPNDPDVEEVR